MKKLFDILTAPTKLFTDLKEKPEWVVPFIIILIVIALAASVVVVMTKDTIIAKQEEVLRERGAEQEQIDQVKKFLQGPLPVVSGAISGAVATAAILLLFTLALHIFIPLFGGVAGFKSILSVVSFAALIRVPAAVIKMILSAVTRSPFVTTSLALAAPNLEKTSFLYQLLAGFDFFIIWEMILVAIGINIVNNVKKENAYILVFLIWLVSLFIPIGLGALFNPAA
jgi:hypothetical protein